MTEYKIDDMRHIKMEVTITFTRKYRVRSWVGMYLFRLAGWVCGMDIVVSRNMEAEPLNSEHNKVG